MEERDVAAIASIAADYIEGWYNGDAARMERALHDELVKRTMAVSDGELALRAVTKERMVEMTAAGGGEQGNPPFEVFVDDISGDIASARTVSPEYVDYLQLARTPQGWQIVNILFRTR